MLPHVVWVCPYTYVQNYRLTQLIFASDDAFCVYNELDLKINVTKELYTISDICEIVCDYVFYVFTFFFGKYNATMTPTMDYLKPSSILFCTSRNV